MPSLNTCWIINLAYFHIRSVKECMLVQTSQRGEKQCDEVLYWYVCLYLLPLTTFCRQKNLKIIECVAQIHMWNKPEILIF